MVLESQVPLIDWLFAYDVTLSAVSRSRNSDLYLNFVFIYLFWHLAGQLIFYVGSTFGRCLPLLIWQQSIPNFTFWCFSLRCFLKINLQLVGFWSYLLGKLSLPRKPRTSSEDACWAVVTFLLYFIADQISSVFNYLNSTLTFTCWSLFLENTKKSSRQQILNDSYSVLTLFFSSVFFSNPSSPSPHLFLTCFRWACGGQRK